jgi:uncharacterized membrane protein
MKSTAHLKGHPVHPMLIPYPFALLTSAVVFDIGARIARRPSWSTTAQHLTTAGLASALVAAVPGAIDYFGSIPPNTRTRDDATKHALYNLTALTCFAIAHSRRRRNGQVPRAGIALGVIGTAWLSFAGWLGGELIYHQHVAVNDDVRDESPRFASNPRVGGGDAG